MRLMRLKRAIPIGCALIMALSFTGCETPSQSATKRPDTMGSATAMLTGHRPKKKKPDDEAKKMANMALGFSLFGATYVIYNIKRKRA